MFLNLILRQEFINYSMKQILYRIKRNKTEISVLNLLDVIIINFHIRG